MLALAFLLPAAARAQSDDGRYNIMAPEKPQKKPLRKHPRGSSTVVYPTPLPPPLHYIPPPTQTVTTPPAAVPPSLYLPQTGRTLPNLPSTPNETSQDRAVRCAHQAGVYGSAAGDRNAYIGTCINQ